MCGCMYGTFTKTTFISPFFSSPINAGVLSMVAGLVIVPIVSLITKVSEPQKIDKMFGCYDRKVTVHASTSLMDAEEVKK